MRQQLFAASLASAVLAAAPAMAAPADPVSAFTSALQSVFGAISQLDVVQPDPTLPAGTDPGQASASASLSQVSSGSVATATNASALIEATGVSGGPITTLNQAAGVGATQANLLSLAFVGGSGGTALAEAQLSQVSQNNSAYTTPGASVTMTATISNALNGNHGIVAVNQAAGVNNTQANVISIASVGGKLPGF